MAASLTAVFTAVVLSFARMFAAPKSFPLDVSAQAGALLLIALTTEHPFAGLATVALPILLGTARRTGSCMAR